VLGFLLVAQLAYAGECSQFAYQSDPCAANMQCPVGAASPIASVFLNPPVGVGAPRSIPLQAVPAREDGVWNVPAPPPRYPLHILFRRYLS
jgi:hypothetical protein